MSYYYKEGEDVEICRTQLSNLPTVGNLPSSSKGDNGSGDHLVLGLKDMVPRWDVHTAAQGKLQYYLQASTFRTPDEANFIQSLLGQAASIWNGAGASVQLQAATNAASASFDVVFDKNGNDGATAMSFFPNAVGKFYIYPPAFDDAPTKAQMLNSVAHEFGHIMGLRHEFALDTEKDEPAVQFEAKNPNSIMSYNRATRSVQPSDKQGLKDFYELVNGATIDDVPVVDFPAKVVQR